MVAAIVIAACFFPWVSIESKGITITGFDTEGTRYGKPGWLHVVISSVYIFLLILNKTWSRRVAFFICAINIAWAVRNFLIVSACSGGECPQRHTALYILVIAAIATMILALFTERSKKKTI